jgi:glycosyltransferase 2 family protein
MTTAGPGGFGRRRGWLRALAGLALLALVIAFARPREALAALRQADPLPLAGAAAGYAAVVLCDALRLRAAFDLGMGEALRLTLVGLFFGNFTPGMVGADVYKVTALARGAGLARPVALAALLRLVGLLAVLVPAVLVLLLAPGRFAATLQAPGWNVGARPLHLMLLILLLLLGLAAAWRWGRRAPRLLRWRQELSSAFVGVGRKRLALLVLLSLGVAGARAASLLLLAASVGGASGAGGTVGAITAAEAVVLGAVATAAVALPLSLGGLGVTEGALAAGLVLLGLGRPEAVAAALLNRALLWVAAAVGGLLLARQGAAGLE